MAPSFTEIADFLTAQTGLSLVALFWYVLVFEVPRYGFLFLIVGLSPRASRAIPPPDVRVSAVIAGHSEAASIKACVGALREQSRPPDEIIVVSDGSIDEMPAILGRMQREGQVSQAHCTRLRGGKAAAGNLAFRHTTGDIIVNVDCDCSFDRHAIRNLIAPFGDPSVGVVAGNVVPRNATSGLAASFQAIEYLLSISLGRQAADMLGQVSCVSGAMGAFRRSALESVGGLDAGSGEDLDLTLRLRRAGATVRFAPDAICYTDVPESFLSLARQRFRWERDAVRLRYRKHGALISPLSRSFSGKEAIHELEFLVFSVLASAFLPIYILWMTVEFGAFGLLVVVAAQVAMIAFDLALFLCAARATPIVPVARLLPYVPGFSVFNNFVLRPIRLFAYVQEWVFSASSKDDFVPAKVRSQGLRP